MSDKVLVAYATKYGATAEIAEKIGEGLRQAGLTVDVLPVKQVSNPKDYSAVVLGSAAYIGQWRKEAVKFLKNNVTLLAERPVWLFVSGPAGEGDPVKLLEGRIYPKGMQPVIDGIKPRDITVFHGVINNDKLNFLEKRMLKMVKSPDGDFRDWDAIAAWAAKIAEELKK